MVVKNAQSFRQNMANDFQQAESTLARLQALDSRFDGLEQQLLEAARIVGLGKSDALTSFGRAEWLMRWLTQKAKTSREARSLARTWSTLAQLIKVIPESTSARILHADEFIHSLKKALDELLDDNPVNASFAPSKRSNKRKRDQDASEQEPLSAKDAGARREAQFGAIRTVLTTLVKKANSAESQGSTIASGRLRAVLRADAELASDILSSWIRLTLIQLSSPAQMEENLMYPIIDIWKLRSIPATDELGTSSGLFSKYCLVPAALLNATCVTMLETERVEFEAVTSDCSASVKRLVLEHIIGPARSSYCASRPKSRELLESLMEPIAAAIKHCNGENLHYQLGLLLRAVSDIFEMAVSGLEACTPKQRQIELQWLNALFEYLSDSVGQLIVYQPPEHSKPWDDSPLALMLQAAITHKATIQTPTLQGMLSKHSGLSDANPEHGSDIRWRLVTAVLELEPDIFTANELSDPAAVVPWFRADLVNRISGTTHDPETSDYLIRNVLVGLATAFSRVGNLNGFLSLWVGQLAKIWDHEFSPGNEQDLWMSGHLHVAAILLIRKSLLPAQVKEIFEEYSGLVDLSTQEISGSDGNAGLETLEVWKMTLPALVVIEAILEAASEAEMLRDSTDVLRTLSLNLQSLLKLVTPFPKLERRLWRVLPKVQKLLFQAEDTKTIVSQVGRLAASLHQKAVSLMDGGPIELSCQAFLCMLVVFQQIWHMEEARDTIRTRINDMCTALASNCIAARTPENDDLRLVRAKGSFDIIDDVQVKIALLAMHPYSLELVIHQHLYRQD
jgi:hypothetical protein